MIAKQYTVPLPADYDMGLIRNRVAKLGPSYDTFAGLHFKAFLIRERGRAGSIANEYAPFYVWKDTESLWRFAAGDGFRGIIDSFGRPPIHTWLSWHVNVRPGLQAGEVRSATREENSLPAAQPLAAMREEEKFEDDQWDASPTVCLRVIAVNIERWTLVRFTLWNCRPDEVSQEVSADRFEVLHLAAPGLRTAGEIKGTQ
jgi:Domain of unknown function (DUF4865)